MKKVTFLHCADLHLDMPFTYMGNGWKSKERRNDLLKVFDKIIGIVSDKRPDLLLISGDLYEHQFTSRNTMNYVRQKFAGLGKTIVVLLPGNHDPYSSNSFYSTVDWPENVHVLSGDKPFVELKEMGVRLYGLGWQTDVNEGLNRIKQMVNQAINPLVDRLFNQPIDQSINEPNHRPADQEPAGTDFINLLLFHGTVDMSFSKQAFNPVSSEDLAELNMDYIAAGHFHNCFREAGPKKNIFNPGSPEALAVDQTEGENGVFLCSVAKDSSGKVQIEADFISTGQRRHRDVYLDVDITGSGMTGSGMTGSGITGSDITDIGITSCERLEKAAKEALAEAGGKEDLYRVYIRGFRGEGVRINPSQLEEKLAPMAFFVKVLDETKEAKDYEALKDAPGIKGLFITKILEKMKEAEDDRSRRMLERALNLGLQALDEGKVELETNEV